jgi:tocopherol O-methyltransferase
MAGRPARQEPAALGAHHRRPTQVTAVPHYYDATFLDYRAMWMNGRNLSMHLGYWDDRTRGHAHSLLRMNAILAEHAAVAPGEVVLDAGCGVGGSALWLAAEHGAEVTGVSLSARQVQLAQRYARTRGLSDRCTFFHQDFHRLALPHGSFDIVWAHESVCHAPDKPTVLAEAFRVLRPGGRLVVGDGFRTRRLHASDDDRHLAAWLHAWAVPDLATTGEFTGWCAQVGFEDPEVRDVSPHVAPSLRRLHRIGAALHLPAGGLHHLGLRSDAQHDNVRGSRLAWSTFRRGLWHYAVVCARKPEPARSRSRRVAAPSSSSETGKAR